MMTPLFVTGILFLLTVVDGFLAVWIGFFPDHFTRTLHGSADSNSRVLARRTAGFWAAFTLVQALALIAWARVPALLLVVAGVRFTECLADWILLQNRELTVIGRIGYFVSVPYTVGFGLFLSVYAVTRTDLGLTGPLIVPDRWFVSHGLVGLLLVGFFLFNLIRSLIALGLPGRWYLWMHGRVGNDTTGLLARTGGIWLGMALVEGLVFYFWEVYPFLLPMVAGLRFTEILADWIYLGTARSLTGPGRTALLALPFLHLGVGFYFFFVHLSLAGG
jgi:hypothetical protein